jgi:uncharacterized protein YgiM (DUF1202 family)
MRLRYLIYAVIFLLSSCTDSKDAYYKVISPSEVRTGEGEKYPVAFQLNTGDEVEVLSQNGMWFKVKHLDKTGYVNSRYLVPAGAQQSQSRWSGFNSVWIIVGLIFVIWLLPIGIILASNKTVRAEKIAWLIAVIFVSWFAWIFYIIFAPIKKRE